MEHVGLTPTRVGTIGGCHAESGPGLTPTRVGTTRGELRPYPIVARQAHPHTRGDDVRFLAQCNRRSGLTPHARGDDGQRPTSSIRRVQQAHPHTRGDDRARSPTPPSRLRAHPHTRGDDVASDLYASPSQRLTPTRVGTTRSPSTTPRAVAWAHPHTRGDDAAVRWARAAMCGSPPHAWGRRQPAGTASRAIVAAHPHTRGDDPCERDIDEHRGSPPHAWGRHAVIRRARRSRRLTPTRVGTTRPSASTFRTRSPAHPHTRGDDWLRLRCDAGAHGIGLTPTRVGTTIWLPVRHPTRDDRRAPEKARLTPTRVGTTPRSRR